MAFSFVSLYLSNKDSLVLILKKYIIHFFRNQYYQEIHQSKKFSSIAKDIQICYPPTN
ncbi:hypothetical protein PEC301296_11400 [Pectobacterium carotovorum subsp. carotovorum]|nr:hypothetical protein PEC301296_11400 [Pectobacterium carotovorum subsp. carotovorum]